MTAIARVVDRGRPWRAPIAPADARRVVVVGSGAAGLAVAALSRRAGIDSVILDRNERPGGAWPDRYDTLRLNTVRWMSDLPGLRMGRTVGRWPTRDDYADYLRSYERWHALEVRRGVRVERVEIDADEARAITDPGSPVTGSAVVIATGHSAVPRVPDWLGADDFEGTCRHAVAYRRPQDVSDGRVLVVGAGSSGGEIVLDLLSAGIDVVWSIRSAPHVFPREALGVPTTPLGALADLVPRHLVDRVAPLLERALHGPRDYLPQPPSTLFALLDRGKEPMTADGIVDAIRAGRVTVVPAVARLRRAGAELVDGSVVPADHVIAATGYRPGLEPLVGHLGVLDEHGRPTAPAPRARLGFVGFRVPLGGTLWGIGQDAHEVVRSLRLAG